MHIPLLPSTLDAPLTTVFRAHHRQPRPLAVPAASFCLFLLNILLSSPPEVRAFISSSSLAAIFDVEAATDTHGLLYACCTVPLPCFFLLVLIVVFSDPVLSRVPALSLSTPTPATHPSCALDHCSHSRSALYFLFCCSVRSPQDYRFSSCPLVSPPRTHIGCPRSLVSLVARSGNR